MKKLRLYWSKYLTYVLVYCLLVGGSCLLSGNLSAQTLPQGFTTGKVQDGYDLPMGLVFSPDGQQLFLWERKGLIWLSTWNGFTYVRQSTPILDITEEVANWGEVGMLSMCLDPNFTQNKKIYLFYAVDRHHLLYYGTPQYDATANIYNEASIGRVTRYTLNQAGSTFSTNYASRKVLLGENKKTGIPLLKGTHLGGTIVMGRDGTLLVSTGDNASWAVVDLGSASDTFYQTALNDTIIRPAENVGAFRSQLLNSMCGKILRIDTTSGDGLPSNPFYNPAEPRSASSRVWTLGFRNPFKMTLQPNTGSTDASVGNPGTLLVGDVGWFSWEELSVIDRAGLNAGWPLYEGIDPAPGYPGTNVRNIDEPGQPTFESQLFQPTSSIPDPSPAIRRMTHYRPALDWLRDQLIARVPTFNGTNPTRQNIGSPGAPVGTPFGGNCAIGGTFYTGNLFPSAYQNSYFFADFGQNWIKNITYSTSNGQWVSEVRDFAAAGSTQGIVALDVAPVDRSLYYIDTYSGELHRIGYGGNRPPVAQLSVDTTYGTSPLTVHFDASASTDPDGNPLNYEWDFGDGTTATGVTAVHSFTSTTTAGFTVTLTVRDGGNLTDTKTKVISVNNQGAPTVKIINPANGQLYPLTQVSYLTLNAQATDVNDNTTTPQFVQTYQWQVTLRHNTHEHREPIITAQSPTVAIDPAGCDLGEVYYYLIRCTVTDNGGLTATDSVKIYPDCSSGSIAVTQVKATPKIDSIRLSWRNPTVPFDEVLVAVRADSGFNDKPNGTSYTADSNFLGSGSSFDGGKIVYRGTDTTVTVTGVNVSNLYYLRVYTRSGVGWNGGVEINTRPLADVSCSMYTVKSGDWNDPETWSCYRLPNSTDAVQVNHLVTIPANYTGLARSVQFSEGVDIRFGALAKLILSP